MLNYKWFRGKELQPDKIGRAIDLLLRDADRRQIDYLFIGRDEPIENQDIVDFVFEQTIVLEQSPPFGVKFKDLLKKTNAPVVVGTIMGMGMAGDSPGLMLITVPGGIIAVSSALGIGDAMAYGLNKQIKRLFDGK